MDAEQQPDQEGNTREQAPSLSVDDISVMLRDQLEVSKEVADEWAAGLSVCRAPEGHSIPLFLARKAFECGIPVVQEVADRFSSICFRAHGAGIPRNATNDWRLLPLTSSERHFESTVKECNYRSLMWTKRASSSADPSQLERDLQQTIGLPNLVYRGVSSVSHFESIILEDFVTLPFNATHEFGLGVYVTPDFLYAYQFACGYGANGGIIFVFDYDGVEEEWDTKYFSGNEWQAYVRFNVARHCPSSVAVSRFRDIPIHRGPVAKNYQAILNCHPPAASQYQQIRIAIPQAPPILTPRLVGILFFE